VQSVVQVAQELHYFCRHDFAVKWCLVQAGAPVHESNALQISEEQLNVDGCGHTRYEPNPMTV